MKASADIDINVAVHIDSGRYASVLVSDDGDSAHAVWIPRSQIRALHLTGQTTKGKSQLGQRVTLPIASLTIPEWLAEQRGLV